MGFNKTAMIELWRRLNCQSIYWRILFANSLIIITGAVGGTLITRNLAIYAADLWLIILFATVGTALSILINSWIIRNALYPLRELRRITDRVQSGKMESHALLLTDTDPDICQLSAALQSLVHQLEKRNRQLRALSEQVINAQEEERKRIALSLHDDTGQSLSMLIISLERLQNRLPLEEGDLRSRLSTSRQLAEHALGELRKIVRDLRPTILDTLGLVPAIRWYARTNLDEAGIRLQIDCEEEDLPLSGHVNSTLFRISQEAINNIVRHSQAKTARIRLYRDEANVYLSVEDDGIGFDLLHINGQALDKQQWGLVGIKERAELIGGEVELASAYGQGTRLKVRVPLVVNVAKTGAGHDG